MKVLYKMSLTLGLVATFSGFTLASIYQKTELKIRENKEREFESSVSNLVSGVVRNSEREIEGYSVFYLYDKDSHLLSYAVIAGGNGYQGEIKILVILSKDLKSIKGIDILESVETPGLGGKITSKDFKNQFKNLEVSSGVDYIKGRELSNPNQIQAITGATISSLAVVKIINLALDEIIPGIKKDG
ncbi:MAG: FMN-binding protein [Candidatus Kaelpia aquatica]|nr:FMN-binding protein [Candidatus Kaelpia aquatica]